MRLPSERTRVRITALAHELGRLAGELMAIGIDAPTIEARFIALSLKHRRALQWGIGAELASEAGRNHLAYVRHLCPDLDIDYRRGVFYIQRKGSR